jgi:hypothetical protein
VAVLCFSSLSLLLVLVSLLTQPLPETRKSEPRERETERDMRAGRCWVQRESLRSAPLARDNNLNASPSSESDRGCGRDGRRGGRGSVEKSLLPGQNFSAEKLPWVRRGHSRRRYIQRRERGGRWREAHDQWSQLQAREEMDWRRRDRGLCGEGGTSGSLVTGEVKTESLITREARRLWAGTWPWCG